MRDTMSAAMPPPLLHIESADFNSAGLIRFGRLASYHRDDSIAIGGTMHGLFDQTIAQW
jgi:hypothetical protein